MFKQQRGIAIVTVLVVLVAVLVLGAGAMFLTQMNLNIASNVGTNAIAEANANAGLEVAFFQLERAFRLSSTNPQSASFPATLTLGSATGPGFSPEFNLVQYQRESTDVTVARVSVRGTGPRNAEHVVAALVRMFPGQPEFPPGFGFGLASEGVINVNGNSSYINAGIHGNLGFNLTGNVSDDFFVCTARNSLGVCISTTAIPLTDAPVSASPGATTCSPTDLCVSGAPRTLTSPIAVRPDYVVRRRGAVAGASSAAIGAQQVTYDGVTIGCDIVVSQQSQLAAALPAVDSRNDKTLCLTSSTAIAFPANFDTGGMNIISTGPIYFDRSGGDQPLWRNSTIVTHTGSVRTANDRVTIESSRIFSEGSIDYNGQQTSISGVSTLASNGSIVINGGAPGVSSADGPAIGLSLISTGSATINGSANWYVAATVGGTFTQNGTATVYGVIEAVSTLTINGGIDIDSGLPIVNNDSKVEGPPRLGVVSQR